MTLAKVASSCRGDQGLECHLCLSLSGSQPSHCVLAFMTQTSVDSAERAYNCNIIFQPIPPLAYQFGFYLVNLRLQTCMCVVCRSCLPLEAGHCRYMPCNCKHAHAVRSPIVTSWRHGEGNPSRTTNMLQQDIFRTQYLPRGKAATRMCVPTPPGLEGHGHARVERACL